MEPKKRNIPKALRISIWDLYIGEDIGSTKCMCCEITKITQMKFHCGYIIAEAKGGTMNVNNMCPICESCNKSMGTNNMEDFKKMLTSSLNNNMIKAKNNPPPTKGQNRWGKIKKK